MVTKKATSPKSAVVKTKKATPAKKQIDSASVPDETQEDMVKESPVPGISFHALKTMIVSAARDDDDTVLDGIRVLISNSGKDPDLVIEEVLSSSDSGDDSANIENVFVDFHGRKIEVTAPSMEQLMVIMRLEKQIANMVGSEVAVNTAIKMMDKTFVATCSILVNDADVDFLEDLMLRKEVTVTELIPFLTTALKILKDANEAKGDNRETRRAERKKSGCAALVTDE